MPPKVSIILSGAFLYSSLFHRRTHMQNNFSKNRKSQENPIAIQSIIPPIYNLSRIFRQELVLFLTSPARHPETIQLYFQTKYAHILTHHHIAPLNTRIWPDKWYTQSLAYPKASRQDISIWLTNNYSIVRCFCHQKKWSCASMTLYKYLIIRYFIEI